MSRNTLKIQKKKSHTASSVSSQRWLDRNSKDTYVQLAKSKGYRSRSVFKLIEINKKFNILRPNANQNILELGSSPGGWSQLLSEILSENNRANIVSVDLIPMKPVYGIEFIHGDFLDPYVESTILSKFKGEKLDLILSDIAPNFTGHRYVDQARMKSIFEDVLDKFLNKLNKRAVLISKIFPSTIDSELKSLLSTNFLKIKYFKPKSSRKESEEIYLIAINKK